VVVVVMFVSVLFVLFHALSLSLSLYSFCTIGYEKYVVLSLPALSLLFNSSILLFFFCFTISSVLDRWEVVVVCSICSR